MPFNEEHYESNFNFHDESSFTSNDDYESNSLVDIYQDISADEYDFQDEDKEDLKYYIGLCLEDDDGRLLLGISISLETLFKYDFDYIEQYLDYDNAPVTLEIMQLHISEDLTYCVVLKTFWLKILQRTWRRIYQQRQKIIQMRKSVHVQEHFRINGKYPLHARYFPKYSESIINKQEKSFVKCQKI
jgi:hypothetical protein